MVISKSLVSDSLAADMDKALNSEENTKLFSRASMLQKLAFEEKQEEIVPVTETVEVEAPAVEVTASDEGGVMSAVDTLLEVSDQLEEMGLEKSAALMLRVTGSLIVEAKAKKSKKSKKSKDSKKSTKDSKKSTKDVKKSKEKETKKSKEDPKKSKKSSK